MRVLLLVAGLLLAPIAQADDGQCKLALGRGWPPATEMYGTAVEKLFAGEAQPALSVTLLPRAGAESGVLLVADPNGGDWLLRRAVADERVHAWEGGKLVLRTAQTPEFSEAPIPDAVASRFVEEWRHVLSTAAPEGSTAPFSEDDTWLFVVGDPGSSPGQALRVSGLKPTCELGALLRDQLDLLIEASDEGEEKREKRWRQLGESLDRMRGVLDAMGATAAAQ
jgi:hypothetical protein